MSLLNLELEPKFKK